MEYTSIIVIGAIVIGAIVWIKKSNEKEDATALYQKAETNEDKMLLLQKETNKRLKSIDTTLDWFFWIMILSFVLYIFSAVGTALMF